jgi:hypothetical protein
MRVGLRILERCPKQNLFDRIGRGLYAARPGEIFAQSLTNERPE